jgi:hypothetical protein
METRARGGEVDGRADLSGDRAEGHECGDAGALAGSTRHGAEDVQEDLRGASLRRPGDEVVREAGRRRRVTGSW